MELHHLRYFVAVAENLNFTRAAEKLFLTQPSLTRQIRNLEEEIGVRLLNRTKSSVALTPAGRSFLTDARDVLSLAAEGVKKAQRADRSETGPLNFGYWPYFDFEPLPKILDVFRQRVPAAAPNLLVMNPAAQFRALETGRIDLAFLGVCCPAAGPKLKCESVRRFEVMAGIPSGHRLAKSRRVHLRNLTTLFFGGLSEDISPGFCAWITAVCRSAGFAPKILQNIATEADLLQFVADGLGVALVTGPADKLSRPGVTFRTLSPIVYADYFIAWNPENPSEPLTQFIRIVRSHNANHRPVPPARDDPESAARRPFGESRA